MKKEIVLAICLGLILGLIVTYGVYRARVSLDEPPMSDSVFGSPVPSPSAAETAHNSIQLISPDDESVQDVPDVKVIGTTDPNAQVIIFINDTPQILTSDTSGNFSIQDKLKNGANFILVRTIDEEGNVAEIERTVVYTTIDFDEQPTATFSATPSATPKATVKPKVSTGSAVPR